MVVRELFASSLAIFTALDNFLTFSKSFSLFFLDSVSQSPYYDKDLLQLAMKWLKPQLYKKKDGTTVETTNPMGGETSQ